MRNSSFKHSKLMFQGVGAPIGGVDLTGCNICPFIPSITGVGAPIGGG